MDRDIVNYIKGKRGIRMKKYELREQGFSVEERTQRKRPINILWLIFTVLMIIGTYIVLIATIGYSPAKAGGSPIDIDVNYGKIFVYFGVLIIAVLLYYGLKLFMTLLFCRDKENSACLKTLQDKSLPIFPVCFCREAFKVWQIVVMYLTPIIIIYALMFFLCIFPPIDVLFFGEVPFESVDAGYMTMLFFMAFFMSFDLTLIVYALFFKIKDKVDYISADHHIYVVTLFKQTYVRLNRNKNKYLKDNSKFLDNGKFRN